MNYSQIINDKMNSDIKNRYATILEKEYNIVREPLAQIIPLAGSQKKSSAFKYLAAAMVLLFVTAGLFFTTNMTNEDPKEMVHQYMAENDLLDIATTRSTSSNSESITPEEQFSLAMNLLQNEKYNEAVSAFEKCKTTIQKGQAFYHETKVYLIISLVLNDENNLAKSLFKKLPENSWERKQLQQIMLNVE